MKEIVLLFNFISNWMIQPPSNSPQRQTRLRLPFENRPSDIGVWSYDHRIGLCSMVIFMLVLGIIFVSAKITIGSRIQIDGFIIDLHEPPKPIEQQEPEEKRLTEQDFSDVKNLTSNENAKELNEKLRDDRGTKASEIYNEADKVQQKIRANRESYESGLREEQAMIDAKNKDKQTTKREDTKVKGRVTVSFSLVNPLRSSDKLVVPAYRCEGGGEIVVNITVNNNGQVTSASIDKSRSDTDNCMTTTALNAARGSRFNVDSSAPSRHDGTISYIFIPQ